MEKKILFGGIICTLLVFSGCGKTTSTDNEEGGVVTTTIQQQTIEIETSSQDNSEEAVLETGCSAACDKYAKCAGYAEDAVPEDINEAYKSCMEVCGTWSSDTVSCINRNPINQVMDCAHLSACALTEYQGLMN